MEQDISHPKETPHRITRSRNQKVTSIISKPSSTRKSPRLKSNNDSYLTKYEDSDSYTIKKKIKPNFIPQSKELDTRDIEVETNIESGSTTERSQDGEGTSKYQQTSNGNKRKPKEIDNRIENLDVNDPKTLDKATQTQSLPTVLKTYYDEGKGDLIFRLQTNEHVFEMPRFDLLKENPMAMLYFYEMHIEFTDPSECGTVALAKL